MNRKPKRTLDMKKQIYETFSPDGNARRTPFLSVT